MASRLAALVLAAMAVAPTSGSPAFAEQVCQSVRVDLINDWIYCVTVVQNDDGSVTVRFECDMTPNRCIDAEVTVP